MSQITPSSLERANKMNPKECAHRELWLDTLSPTNDVSYKPPLAVSLSGLELRRNTSLHENESVICCSIQRSLLPLRRTRDVHRAIMYCAVDQRGDQTASEQYQA